MNRETEQHFTQLPELHIPRSKFVKPNSHTSTFSTSMLIPAYVNSDILPGTTVNMKMAAVIRMLTPLYPTFGNMNLDVFWFFCPHRLVWTHWKEFWGENPSAWYPAVNYTTPQLKTDGTVNGTPVGANAKSLWDYMGLPTDVPGLSVSALPFRAYCKIWNDWFRSGPLQSELPLTLGDNDETFDFLLTYKGGVPARVNKYHDYFTSALPTLMYGNGVNIPLGTVAPVTTLATRGVTNATEPLAWRKTNGNDFSGNIYSIVGQKNTDNIKELKTDILNSTATATAGGELYPTNLWADLANGIGPTLQALRQAVAIDHYLEARARVGSNRYVEFLRGIYGVSPADASLQRSEYLGGKRIPINIYTQVQSSSTDQTSPLGTTGAFSHTADANEYFTKSFDDFGTLMCLVCVRYEHQYQQGINRMWSRKTPYDYYLPQLNGLSEQSILNKELYATGTATDDQVFGYQEYAAEYRYANSYVTGEMRSNYAQSLDAWHYADDYNALPVLGSTWIKESQSLVDRTLAVPSNTADQFLADFYFKPTFVMPMPIYSVPGLDTL